MEFISLLRVVTPRPQKNQEQNNCPPWPIDCDVAGERFYEKNEITASYQAHHTHLNANNPNPISSFKTRMMYWSL